MSELTDAYKMLQTEFGAKKDDMVRVLRSAEGGEMGFGQFSRLSERDRSIGKILRVTGIAIDNYGIKLSDGYHYPFFCLELVEKAKPELPPINIGDMPVKFLDGKIKVCGETISKETIEQILDRLEN